MSGKLFFKLGFKAGLPSKLMEIGKFLKTKAVPRIWDKTKGLAAEFGKTHAPALVGGSLGWTAASHLGKNLAQGEELDAGKFTDDFVNNLKEFGIFDIGLFGLSKAFGGMKNLSKHLISQLKGTRGALKQVLPKDQIKKINDAIREGAKAGKDYSRGKPSKLINYLPYIGATAGAAMEYDEDAPISSLTRGAVGGGLIGKGVGLVPGIPGPKLGVGNSMLDALQTGLAFSAVDYGLDRKAKRQKNKDVQKYYQQLQSRGMQ